LPYLSLLTARKFDRHHGEEDLSVVDIIEGRIKRNYKTGSPHSTSSSNNNNDLDLSSNDGDPDNLSTYSNDSSIKADSSSTPQQTTPYPTLSITLPNSLPESVTVLSPSPLATEAAEAAKVLYEMSLQQNVTPAEDVSLNTRKKLRSGVSRGLSFDLPPEFGSFQDNETSSSRDRVSTSIMHVWYFINTLVLHPPLIMV